jgi:hypothetical protein
MDFLNFVYNVFAETQKHTLILENGCGHVFSNFAIVLYSVQAHCSRNIRI